MAKKVIATLSKGDAKKLTKLIQVKKSEKTGAYTFRSRIVPPEILKEILSEKA
jgi:hypothetical protein